MNISGNGVKVRLTHGKRKGREQRLKKGALKWGKVTAYLRGVATKTGGNREPKKKRWGTQPRKIRGQGGTNRAKTLQHGK